MANGAVVIPDHHSQRQQDVWTVITALVLDGIASPHTRRAYSQALEEFLIWFRDVPGREFNKAAVQKYRSELQAKGLAASSINVRLSAIRRLALEAADNQMMPPDIAAGIGRAKGARRGGVRLGHWLTAGQAESLLSVPDLGTAKGIRDYAILALLLMAGLRRSELAMLAWQQMQQREERWLIVNLSGKHGRIRSVPIPLWVYAAVAHWDSFAGIGGGLVFRAVNRHGSVLPNGISPQSVFEIVKTYARKLGLEIAPHDLRRSFARLAHQGQSPLEQIQLSLGHASLITTELYLGIKQDLRDAPCDRIPIPSRALNQWPDKLCIRCD